jgi:hypothetical protein
VPPNMSECGSCHSMAVIPIHLLPRLQPKLDQAADGV